MKKFIIKDDFFKHFPDVKIWIVVAQGIDNTIRDKEKYEAMLA